MPRASQPAPPGPAGGGWFGITRSGTDRIVSGLAAGLGTRLSVDPVYVRVAFAALAAAGGAGIVLYLLLWAVSDEPARTPGPVVWRPPATRRRAVALGLQVVGMLLLLRSAGWWLGDAVVWPTALAALGSAVIYARADEHERARWALLTGRVPASWADGMFTARVSPLRLAFGAVLVTVGLGIFLAANATLAAAWSVLVAVVVTAVGLTLVLGPAAIRLGRQLGEERRARIRSQERAEMAAHLHDSVLHTLALIQRTSDPRQAASLARGQERELRAWLAGRTAPEAAGRLATAVDAMAGRIERQYALPVEVVVVGDAPLDAGVQALVDAAGEAAANAARHADARSVSVYVEVEPDEITAYVRDEGKGFDPATIPADRRGITESVIGRMTRNGGSATIISEPGEGTEVGLHLPRRKT
jgi:signal transduction histidine kinase/phage shock protein PspC (stress-responsive transcriptional regulator)